MNLEYNRIEQCCAFHIVHSCQQYYKSIVEAECGVTMWAAQNFKHSFISAAFDKALRSQIGSPDVFMSLV